MYSRVHVIFHEFYDILLSNIQERYILDFSMQTHAIIWSIEIKSYKDSLNTPHI